MSPFTSRFSKTALAGVAIAAALALPAMGASAASAGDAGLPPLAVTDNYSTQQDTQLVVDAANGLLANDLDGGYSDLEAYSVSIAAEGVLDFVANGGFQFTPTPGFVGTAHFTYKDLAGGMYSNDADIFIDVAFVAHKLIGAPDFYTTTMDTPFSTGDHDQLIANDPDSTYVGGIDDATGEILVSIYGELDYTPAPGFVGTKTFSYWLDDHKNTPSDLILVTIEVTAGPISVIPSNPIPHDPGTAEGDLPTLAYTGPDDVTAWLIAPGLALLGLGVFAVWLGRRRAARS